MSTKLSKSFSDLAEMQVQIVDEAWNVFKDKAGSILKVDTIATTSGKIINNRIYRGPKMKDGCKTWCMANGAEYDRPFIKNHDDCSEPIGRIKAAEYKPTVKGSRFINDWQYPTKEGSGFTKITSHIMDEEAIEKFLDGRYLTVSVGGSSDAAYCNICSKKNKDFVNMWGTYGDKDGEKHECDHIPGRQYADSKCAVVTGELEYFELSSVNVPADSSAKHIMMQMVKDSVGNEDSSLWGYFSDAEDGQWEILHLPTRMSILDAKGNPIRSLDVDKHVSSKTISVPSQKPGENQDSQKQAGQKVEDGDTAEKPITNEAFYKARVLKHFSDLGMVVLTDAQKEEVEILDTASLSDSQLSVLDKVFMTHPAIPFAVTDLAEIKATLALINTDQLRCRNKEGWIKALNEQQATNFSNSSEDNHMGDEALKKALAAAQKTVEDMSAGKAEADKKIVDLTQKVSSLEAISKELSDKLLAQTVDKVIDLRAELGFADAQKLDDSKRQALKDSYLKKPVQVVEHLYADLLAQKQAGGFNKKSVVAAADVANPLQDTAEPTKPVVVAPAKTATVIKNSLDF